VRDKKVLVKANRCNPARDEPSILPGAVSALPRCIPSSRRRNSTASIHKPGLPTYCVASPEHPASQIPWHWRLSQTQAAAA
jgi:hypothetical protein